MVMESDRELMPNPSFRHSLTMIDGFTTTNDARYDIASLYEPQTCMHLRVEHEAAEDATRACERRMQLVHHGIPDMQDTGYLFCHYCFVVDSVVVVFVNMVFAVIVVVAIIDIGVDVVVFVFVVIVVVVGADTNQAKWNTRRMLS